MPFSFHRLFINRQVPLYCLSCHFSPLDALYLALRPVLAVDYVFLLACDFAGSGEHGRRPADLEKNQSCRGQIDLHAIAFHPFQCYRSKSHDNSWRFSICGNRFGGMLWQICSFSTLSFQAWLSWGVSNPVHIIMRPRSCGDADAAMLPVELTIIVAATRNMGIGRRGTLPWTSLKKEMAYFARVTKRVVSARPTGDLAVADNVRVVLAYSSVSDVDIL